jgi:hypothetical protein
MTDDEIEQLIAAIEDLLRDLGLGAIVAQERILATEGDVKSGDALKSRTAAIEAERSYRAMPTDTPSLDLTIPQYEVATGTQRKPQRRFKFTSEDVRVTPLDARARLRNLLDLIEVATAGTLAMERIVHDEITNLTTGEIIFVDSPESELRGTEQEPWILTIGSEFQTATAHAKIIVSLLDTLRSQADVARGQELSRGVDDDAEDSWMPKQERP